MVHMLRHKFCLLGLGILPWVIVASDSSEDLAVDILDSPLIDIFDIEAPFVDPTPEWACEVRAWTRAPDLFPGGTIHGQARLAVNGSACKDIVRWEVGLRFKERAIIKMKSKDAPDLPPKPVQPPWNASRHPVVDWNDIYAPLNTFSFARENEEYETALKLYNEAMKNTSLWEVKSQERTVFDLVQEFPWAYTEEEKTDVTDSFVIYVPLTEFPPISSEAVSGPTIGKDQQMLNTETLSEYYHLIHLSNGTVIDIPSGRSGFIPLPRPIYPKETDSFTNNDSSWPQTIDLLSPEEEDDGSEDMWSFGNYRRKPECDKGNITSFKLEVGSNITHPIQGQNITLKMTLTRDGNSSEYPTFIDFRHAISQNVTWAYQFLSNESEYLAFTDTDTVGPSRRRRGLMGLPFRSQRMLIVQTDAELERDRERNEKFANGGFITSGGSGMRWPIGENEARWDFDALDEEYKDVYEFMVELPVPYNAYPSFEKTFESLRSEISVKLHTTFLCALEDEHSQLPGEKTKEPAKDEEWVEYHLPTRPLKKKRGTNGFGAPYEHTGSVALDLQVAPSAGLPTNSFEGELRHYLDSQALGPVIAKNSIEGEITYPKLGKGIRDETVEEQRKQRWSMYDGLRSRRGRCKSPNEGSKCWTLNGGGAWMHAAKVWMGYLRRSEREAEEHSEDDSNTPRLVIQA